MTCAKVTAICTLVTKDGRHIVGTNWCASPQAACPRLPGEDYTKCKTICQQQGHAEVDAVAKAGDDARGAHAYLEGHTYACMDCQHTLFGAGVAALTVGAFTRHVYKVHGGQLPPGNMLLPAMDHL